MSWKKICAYVLSFLIGLPTGLGAAEQRVALTGHVPPQIRTAVKLGRLPAEEPVQLTLAVKLDQDLLNQTVDQIYGPNASPTHRPYLTSAEFAQKFDLANKRQKLKDFAQANGLAIDPAEDRPESMAVKVSGGAGQVEAAFGVELNRYQDAKGRLFRAHETEPMIPASVLPHFGAVLGLSNVPGVLRPHIIQYLPSSRRSRPMLGNTSGKSNSGLAPGDIQTVYGLQGAAFNGSGQTVALVEFDGYTPSDILGYESAYLITPIQVTPVSVDGASNTPGSGAGEVTLDIEMVAAVAPGVSQILVYEAPNSWQGNYDLYNKIATDDIAKIVSTSWGQPELDLGASLANVESQIYQRMAIQGQTIYAASGDNGAFDVGAAPTNNCNGTSKLCVDDPASQPYVTGVGGTSLSGTIQNYTEATWNDASGASGGGISAIWPIPSYQSSINTTANGGSSTMRNVPDVALNADPISSPYSIYFQGGWWSVGGTSAAAPLWAAFTALINQRNAGLGDATLGFANPTLYELATSTSSSTLFNDITIGNNGYYNAGPGYDDATGWGSFKGSALLGAVITGPAPIDYSALASVYAYPNPWDIRRETQRLITFANLPDGATVKIFTLSGFLVRTLTVSGSTAVWDLTNASGQMVASGLYLYLASDGSHNTTGKIAIIK